MFNVSPGRSQPDAGDHALHHADARGLYGFKQMKIQNFPDIDLPTIVVTAALPGASPAQMETEVARKIENSVATVQGVKHIYTKVQDGVGHDHGRVPPREADLQEAVDDVRDAVSRVRSDLPATCATR
jgi:multidrug efflux pump subunit AcrB